jgi:hypothetical protein
MDKYIGKENAQNVNLAQPLHKAKCNIIRIYSWLVWLLIPKDLFGSLS